MSETQAMDTTSTTGPRNGEGPEATAGPDGETATSTPTSVETSTETPTETPIETPIETPTGTHDGTAADVATDVARDDSAGDDSVGDDSAGDDSGGGDADGDGHEGGVRKKSRVRQLEREGEVAADFLETLLDIADLDGDIDVDVDGDRAAIAIVDSDEGRVPRRLVGAEGKVLEALQELTRLAVQVETGERSRLMLDIAGHRAERRLALVHQAQQTIAEVRRTGSKVSLEPMSAFERKVVHDEVSAAGLVSESEGVDPHRHIVILPG